MQIINVMAASLDGAINASPGEGEASRHASGFVTADDKNHVEDLLKSADAVIVGAASVRARNGLWLLPRADRHPVWVVMTTRGIEPDNGFYEQGSVERWLVSPAPLSTPRPWDEQLQNIVCGSANAPIAVAEKLAERGMQKVLLFGGGLVNRAFYAAELVDELVLTVSPRIVARRGTARLVEPDLPSPVRLSLISSKSQGDLVFLHYAILKSR